MASTLCCLVIPIILGLFCAPAQASPAKIYFVNVGQGDFSFLTQEHTCSFFDVGGEKSALSPLVLDLIQRECRGKINFLFLTHFDRDHYIKSFRLFRVLAFKRAYVSHSFNSKSAAKVLGKFLGQHSCPVSIIRQGQTLKINGTKIEVLAPHVRISEHSPENNFSLVLLLHIQTRKVLITGDAPLQSQKLKIQDLDILKVSHHGSRHNSNREILNMLKPRVCVISAGAKNDYGHPHRETLGLLHDSGCTILRTDRLGTLEFDF